MQCGTSGCAIGELPFLFPEHWYRDNIPHLKGEEFENEDAPKSYILDKIATIKPIIYAMKFFGLTDFAAVGLFAAHNLPYEYREFMEDECYETLWHEHMDKVEKDQVASNIEHFLKRYEFFQERDILHTGLKRLSEETFIQDEKRELVMELR
jgi:hypothetical protein